MISVNKDFSHCYTFNGKCYFFKGKKNNADKEFIDFLIKQQIVQYKKVYDYNI
jgi:hypothetical protein